MSNVRQLPLAVDRMLEFPVADAAGQPVNVAGWDISWMLKASLKDDDASKLLEYRTGVGGVAITGTFNVDPTLNTQLVVVTIRATDTAPLQPIVRAYHELKRMDGSFETVLLSEPIQLVRTVHRT